MVVSSNPGVSTFHLRPAPHSDWKYNNASAQRRLMDPGSDNASLIIVMESGETTMKEQGGC